MPRATGRRSAATASSRSSTSASARESCALASLRSLSPGTKSRERRIIWLTSLELRFALGRESSRAFLYILGVLQQAQEELLHAQAARQIEVAAAQRQLLRRLHREGRVGGDALRIAHRGIHQLRQWHHLVHQSPACGGGGVDRFAR